MRLVCADQQRAAFDPILCSDNQRNSMSTIAVIPVKQLHDAKQRLSSVLSGAERHGLFSAMVEDVLIAIRECPEIDGTMIVSNDASLLDLVREFNVELVDEPETPGLNQAAAMVAGLLAGRGVARMLFVHGDLPLVTGAELTGVLDGLGESADAEMAIAPAADLGGSNCVALAPPDCMTFAFGADSFARHMRIAEERGITPNVTRLPGIGLDVDTPEDLAELARVLADASSDVARRTRVYLTTSGILLRELTASA